MRRARGSVVLLFDELGFIGVNASYRDAKEMVGSRYSSGRNFLRPVIQCVLLHSVLSPTPNRCGPPHVWVFVRFGTFVIRILLVCLRRPSDSLGTDDNA